MPSVTLKNPIVMPDGRQYAVVTLDEPTLGGIAAHEMALADTGSESFALIASLAQETGWPREVVSKIRQSDLEAVSELFRPFAPGEQSGESGASSPQTSPTS